MPSTGGILPLDCWPTNGAAFYSRKQMMASLPMPMPRPLLMRCSWPDLKVLKAFDQPGPWTPSRESMVCWPRHFSCWKLLPCARRSTCLSSFWSAPSARWTRIRSVLVERTSFKKKLEDAKSLGLCRHCREPAIEGQTRCQQCAERHRARRREDDSGRRAAAKLSEERPTQEYGRPPKSRRSEQEEACLSSEQRQRERRKAAGLCKNCPEPSKPGRSRCEGCSEKQRVQEREARAWKKAERQQANADQ